jgi:hypothetical protein
MKKTIFLFLFPETLQNQEEKLDTKEFVCENNKNENFRRI